MTEKSSKRSQIGSFAINTALVDDASTEIMARLGNGYCLLQPDKTIDDFAQEVLMPLAASTLDHPGNIEFMYSRAHSQHTYSALMRFLLTACAYCIEADKADEAADQAAAWRNIANAMYYLGLFEGAIIVEPALAHIISDRSAAGAKGRDEKYDTLRALAKNLAQEKPFKSKRQAALSIKDEILAEAKAEGIPLSEMQAERTITGWLKDIPFGSKRKP